MSLKTWLEEFYPITAAQAVEKGETAALNHSIQKFKGLLASNLNRHNVKKVGASVVDHTDGGRFILTHEACTLCILHNVTKYSSNGCYKCPLSTAHKDGNEFALKCSDTGSLYDDITENNLNDVEAAVNNMISALEKIRDSKPVLVKKEKPLTLKEIGDKIGVNIISRREGVITIKKSYFYGMMHSGQALADKVTKAFPDASIIEYGNHFHQFVGGAKSGSPKDSYFWCKFKL